MASPENRNEFYENPYAETGQSGDERETVQLPEVTDEQWSEDGFQD